MNRYDTNLGVGCGSSSFFVIMPRMGFSGLSVRFIFFLQIGLLSFVGSLTLYAAPTDKKVRPGPAGCRRSRADVIPASDKSKERYHRYDTYIREASIAYALPEALLRAVMATESDYDPRVVSCAGAKGLMQVMPDEEIEKQD